MPSPHLYCLVGIAVLVLAPLAGCHNISPAEQPDVAVPHLLELLRDPSPDMRRTAALSLGKIADVHAVPGLVLGTSDQDPLVRQYSVWALGTIGEAALDHAGFALVARLSDPSPAVQAAAARAIGRVGATQGMLELVLDALKDDEVETRRAAALALTWLEAPAAFFALAEALEDDDGGVRQHAVAALGELADARAIPAFRHRLVSDDDPGVRAEAAYRLGKLGDAAVLPVLQFIAGKDENAGVRRWAAWAVAEITQGGTATRS